MNLQQQLRKREPVQAQNDIFDAKESAPNVHLSVDSNVRVLGKSELFTQEKVVKKRAPRKVKDDDDNLLREITDPFADEKSNVRLTQSNSNFQESFENFLFRLNTRRIINQLRSAEYSKVAYERNGPMVSKLVNVMLESTVKMGRSFKVIDSEKMGIDQICAVAFNTSHKSKDDAIQSSNILDKLSEQKFRIVNRHKPQLGSHMSLYSVNIANILHCIWMKNIEALILKKFNNIKFVRVFRAL